MDTFHTLWPCCRSTGIRQGKQRILICRLGLQFIPAVAASFNISLQTFQNRGVKRSAEFALSGIRIGVNDQGDMGMRLSVSVEQVDVLLVDYDEVCLGMVKDVLNIFRF